MAELSDVDIDARAATMQLEELLDTLLDGFRRLRAYDRDEGATDDDAALGGLLMVIDAGVKPTTLKPLVALAVRRIIDGEESR